MGTDTPKSGVLAAFIRDGFSCVNCGSSPPNTMIGVFRNAPYYFRGDLGADELITVCFGCLYFEYKLVDHNPALDCEELVSCLRYARSKAESDLSEWNVSELNKVFQRFFPGYSLSPPSEVSARYFIEQIGFDKSKRAMEAACSRWPSKRNRAFRYFCGICWRLIKGDMV